MDSPEIAKKKSINNVDNMCHVKEAFFPRIFLNNFATAGWILTVYGLIN